MEEIPLLTSIAIFTLLAGVCSIIFNKAKLPPLIGYLVAGIVVANVIGINEIGEEAVEMLSDFGLVLLMFCIGLEINIKKIKKQGRFAIIVAVVQLPLMVLGGMVAGTVMGYDSVQAIALGAIISGSSTAAVLAVLQSQNKLSKEEIEMLVLITIMEDIGQVIMLSMLTPLLAGSSMDMMDLIVLIASIAVFMVVSLAVGLKYIPRVINWISDNVPNEILIVFSVGLAFGMAWLATIAGLSMAIGAFLMGMIISGCRKSKDLNRSIEPMKDLFMAMFFISVGMEVHLNTLVENLVTIVIFYLLFFCLKGSTVFLGYWIGRETGRNGFISAISLTAMGEFAFIISKEALNYGVVDDSFYTSVIGAALLSMIALPIISRYTDITWDWFSARSPQAVGGAISKVNGIRDGIYEDLQIASSVSKKAVSKGMTSIYINFILIIIIEIAFAFAMPELAPMLSDMIGGSERAWYFILVTLNFVALLPPTAVLVSGLKNIDRLVIDGTIKKQVENTRSVMHKELMSVNKLAIIAIFDLFIVALVPNPLSYAEQALMLVVAIGIVTAIYLRLTKNKPDEADSAVPEGSEPTNKEEETSLAEAEPEGSERKI